MRQHGGYRPYVLVAALLAACSNSGAPNGSNRSPISDAGGPYSGAPGVAISFNSAGSSDPDGSIVSYLWSFGDGTSSTIANPSKSYTAVGNYTAALTVTDDSGATNTDHKTVRISIGGGGSPPTVTLATYYGGSDDEMIRDATTDPQGNVYIVGGSRSPNFPVTLGAFNGNYDVVVLKLSATGQLIWSSRLGGPGYDRAYAVEIDQQGNVVIAGRAGVGFPVTPGALQTVFAGGASSPTSPYGEQDGFACKLNGATGAEIWCTYFGANDSGAVRDMDVDASGNLYLASWVAGDYPAAWIKPNAFQPQRAGGQDFSLAKISADGTQVLWCTYLGGTGQDGDGGSVRVMANGDAAFVMTIHSANAPTQNAFQPAFGGGNRDLYVGVMAGDGSALRWGSYLGGSGNEDTETHNLALDSGENLIVAAASGSADFPMAGQSLQPNLSGSTDGVLEKFSPQGAHLAGTFFGGTSSDNFQGVLVGPGDTIYVAGTTQSTTLAGVTGAIGGMEDFFTTRFSDDLSTQYGGVRLGGSEDDEGRNVALGPTGTWYAGGITRSTNWPTVNAAGAQYGGGKEDGVFVIISP